jgi:hypothetical protein
MAELGIDSILSAVVENLKREWPRLRVQIDRLPPAFLADIKSIFEEVITDVDSDADLRNRRQVYAIIADFLANRLRLPRETSFMVACLLCGESDLRLVGGNIAHRQDVEQHLAEAKRSLLAVEVDYLPADSRSYKRTTRIFFEEGGMPKVAAIEERLSWDELPPDVRKDHLTHGASTRSFRLYSHEEERSHA